MSTATSHSPAAKRRPLVDIDAATCLAVACVTATLGYSMWAQSTVHLNHDVGWVLYSAGEMLHGARFGVDVLAANPPLAWYLSIPGALLADLELLPPWTALRAWILLLLGASLMLLAAVLLPLQRSGRRLESDTLLVFAAVVISALPAREFGQREHLALALCLPYVASLAIRYECSSAPSRLTAILVGILAGIGFGLKPYFLVVPLLTSLVLAARSRSIAAIFLTENLAAGATIALYVATLILLTPEYLQSTVPLFRSFYWGFENISLQSLLRRLIPVGTMVAIAAGLTGAARRFTGVHSMLLAAIVGFAIAYLVQGKGYAYHQLPITGLALLLVAYSTAVLIDRAMQRLSLRRNDWAPLLLVLVLMSFASGRMTDQLRSWRTSYDRWSGEVGTFREALALHVASLTAPGDTVYALSTHPYPAFPTVLYAGVDWAGRSNSLVAIPALVKAGNGESPVGFNASRVEAFQRAEVLAALRKKPRVVLVDRSWFLHGIGRRPFDVLAYFARDPAFNAEWRDYRETKPITNTRIFVRRAE